MGGTGLSGLALLDEGWARLLDGAAVSKKNLSSQAERIEFGRGQVSSLIGGTMREWPEHRIVVPPPPSEVADPAQPHPRAARPSDRAASTPASQTVLIANPITNRIQAIKMHRDGPRWRLDKPTDFLRTSDEWFRPVAITTGPDGCLYIVDWYNKIISHNEVPRNHPERDKTRGRIWRVLRSRYILAWLCSRAARGAAGAVHAEGEADQSSRSLRPRVRALPRADVSRKTPGRCREVPRFKGSREAPH